MEKLNSKMLDSTPLSKNIIFELQKKILSYKTEENITPNISIIQIGNNPASNIYIKKKMTLAQTIGINISLERFDENISEQEVIQKILELNNNKDISGIILQLPIPKSLDKARLLNIMDAKKDIDGLNPINIGLLFAGSNQCFIPPTAQGCMELLKYYKINLKSKHVVIVNRSSLVGKPIAELMLREDATVTICHSKTSNLESITKLGDIVICAVGQEKFFTKKYFKQRSVVVDIGTNRIITQDNVEQIVGDVDFDDVKHFVEYLTPPRRSIGPLTVSLLLVNSFIATQLNHISNKTKHE